MENFPSHIYIAIGAVIAALIAGVFSYLGLITSKETKISEFRQLWINALRKDISSYVSSMRSLLIFEDHMINKVDKKKKRKKNTKIDPTEVLIKQACLHDEALKSYYSICLRINRNENKEEAKEINNSFITPLEGSLNLFQSELRTEQSDQINRLLEAVIENGERLLKHEWDRVREGEKAYNLAKLAHIIFGCVITFSIFFFIAYGSQLMKNKLHSSTSIATENYKPCPYAKDN